MRDVRVVGRANEVCVSAVTLWEIAIKHGLDRKGPSAMPVSAQEAQTLFTASVYVLLPITPEETVLVGALPKIHADPFHRLLAAQAMGGGLQLLTHDATLAQYHAGVVLV